MLGPTKLTGSQSCLENSSCIDPQSLTPFVDRLPIPSVAQPAEYRVHPAAHGKIPHYRISMREVALKIHRDLAPARIWGYQGCSPGPTIEVRRDHPISVEWRCELPNAHFLSVDHTIHGAEADKPEVRAVVHVHGAKVPPESDGYPEAWIVPGKSSQSYYPNNQGAATLWYHDHAMGITRLNIYAGLLGLYLVRDPEEDALGLPRGNYELPLVICDRMIDRAGQLHYPYPASPARPGSLTCLATPPW